MQRIHSIATLVLLSLVMPPVFSQSEMDECLLAVNRRKVQELIQAASFCRTAITEAYMTAVGKPKADGWGCEVRASNFSVRTTAHGAIHIWAGDHFLNRDIDNRVITIVTLGERPPIAVDWQAGD